MVKNATKKRLEKLIAEYKKLAYGQERGEIEIALAEIPELVYNSNAIENSTLTLKETEDILLFGKIRRDMELREVYEAKNLARVMEILMENPGQKLSLELILGLHNILLMGINDAYAGRFRAGDEWVRVGGHLGANPAFVNELVYKLVEGYNNDDGRELLEKIAYFHAEFEYIHPFNDGNGRIGRVLLNQQLMREGLPPIMIPAKNRFREYYPLLDEYDKKNSVENLEEYIALLLMEALNKRIATFGAKKTIPLAEWAEKAGMSSGAAINKARRQTIPAFRVRGVWQIAEDFAEG